MKTMVVAFGKPLLVGIVVVGGVGLAETARATPYAFASNQITGLTVTSTTGPITPTAFTETISDSSSFGTSSGMPGFNSARSTATPLTIAQSSAGPVAPTTSGYTASGVGTFVGTRSNAAIGSGDAMIGGVSVSNVAEGSGNNMSIGQSTANNQATFGLTVVGTGSSVVLSFNDIYALIATTTTFGETAQAAITDTVVLTGSNGIISTYAPAALNATSGSSNGTTNTGPQGSTSAMFSFTTAALANGASYTLSLTSSSTESIAPGIAVVPEPTSLALIGSALFGVGMVLRRKA